MKKSFEKLASFKVATENLNTIKGGLPIGSNIYYSYSANSSTNHKTLFPKANIYDGYIEDDGGDFDWCITDTV